MPSSSTVSDYYTITPAITVRGAADAIEFYAKAFGAGVRLRMDLPDGKIMHAQLVIGDSVIMISDEHPQFGARSPQSLGGTVSSLMIRVDDVDAAYQKAVDAGATGEMPPNDCFWGDRMGVLKDPFGHLWSLSTPVEKLTDEQMQQRFQEFLKSGAC